MGDKGGQERVVCRSEPVRQTMGGFIRLCDSGLVTKPTGALKEAMKNADWGEHPTYKNNAGWFKRLAQALKEDNTLEGLAIGSVDKYGYYKFDPADAEALREALACNTTLKRLDVTTCKMVGFDPMRHESCILAGLKANTVLEELNLRSMDLTDIREKDLGDFLASNTSLKRLTVEGKVFGHWGLSAVAKGMQSNSTLEELSVSAGLFADYCSSVSFQCGHDHDGSIARELGEMLADNSSLRKLDLQGAYVGYSMYNFKDMFDALGRNSTLTELNLGSNGEFSFPSYDDGETIFADFIKANRSIKKLGLRGCGFEEGSILLAFGGSAFKFNNALEELDLSNNTEMRNPGGVALAQVLKGNTSLKRLSLEDCLLGDAALERLIKELKAMGSIEYLELGGNMMSRDVVARALADLISNSKNLKRLGLRGCNFNAEGAEEIAKAWGSNWDMIDLDIVILDTRVQSRFAPQPQQLMLHRILHDVADAVRCKDKLLVFGMGTGVLLGQGRGREGDVEAEDDRHPFLRINYDVLKLVAEAIWSPTTRAS